MAKQKICSVCEREVEKLWRSNPATCSPRCDAKLSPEQKGKKLMTIEQMHRAGEIAARKFPNILIKDKNYALDIFYANQILVMPNNCENCGLPLNAWTKWHKRCVTAHILPKATFESVKTHPQNKMFLGTLIAGSGCSCHDDYDRKDAKDRQGMNCYKIALERLQEFVSELTPQEIVRAEKYLGIEL